jgi:hypothetical protein
MNATANGMSTHSSRCSTLTLSVKHLRPPWSNTHSKSVVKSSEMRTKIAMFAPQMCFAPIWMEAQNTFLAAGKGEMVTSCLCHRLACGDQCLETSTWRPVPVVWQLVSSIQPPMSGGQCLSMHFPMNPASGMQLASSTLHLAPSNWCLASAAASIQRPASQHAS